MMTCIIMETTMFMEEAFHLNKATAERSNVLIVLQFFLGIGAIVGGGLLVINPSGELLQMPLSLLENSPFPNYFIPGLLLLLMLGVAPIWIGYGLIRKHNSSFASKLNIFPNQHWSWNLSLYSGFALIIWIVVQTYFLQAVNAVHLLYFALGILIQIVTLLPNVQRKYHV